MACYDTDDFVSILWLTHTVQINNYFAVQQKIINLNNSRGLANSKRAHLVKKYVGSLFRMADENEVKLPNSEVLPLRLLVLRGCDLAPDLAT